MTIEIVTQDHGGAHLRQVVVDGKAVSRLWVLERRIRLLGEPVRMAGIGGVRTHEAHRKKGYARRLLEDTVRFMTDAGYSVSMLFGIPDFYDRYGYAPCLPEHRTVIATRDAERAAGAAAGCSVRRLQPDDFPFIVGLYDRHNRCRSASIIRDARNFRQFSKGSSWHVPADGAVFLDSGGRRVGYAVWDRTEHAVRAVEADASDPRTFPAILCELARIAVARRCGEVELFMPSDHPFVVFTRRFGCRSTVTYHRMGQGMMRILNQEPLFQQLLPALERRLPEQRRVRLRLETDLGTVRLLLNPKGSRESRVTLRAPQHTLMQLVVGYRSAEDVLLDEGVEARGPAAEVLDVLFGRQSPYVWLADWF